MLGGGMRQAGYLAAAGLYALEHNLSRLQEDHARAKILERELRALTYVTSVLPVETNIVIFTLDERLSTDSFLQQLQQQQVRAGSMGHQNIRFVFHLDVSDSQLEALLTALRSVRVPAA
jgi:threonine aldolase